MEENNLLTHTKFNSVYMLNINKKSYKVDPNIGVKTSLNTFIRDHALLPGTKFMCNEGGCGACMVNISTKNPVNGQIKSFPVNSCLKPVLSCLGSSVTTIEGLGSKRSGYHQIQKTLADYSGTQCGYCSPGMVMNMYSLQAAKLSLSKQEIEDSLGGNICRCTGYRPILDAFKSLSTKQELDSIFLKDIEDCYSFCGMKNKTKSILESEEDLESCFLEVAMAPLNISLEDEEGNSWRRVSTVKEIFEILDSIGNKNYILIAGNTAQGVYRPTVPYSVFIDINNVKELRLSSSTRNEAVLGANMTYNEAQQFLYDISKKYPEDFWFAQQMGDFIETIANYSIRSVGTLAGALMLKYQRRDFKSDLFLILETVGATVKIRESSGVTREMPLSNFFQFPMEKKVMTSIIIKRIPKKNNYIHFLKVMPRAQHAASIVECGFRFSMNEQSRIVGKPSLVFGGISSEFVRAQKTETYLTGKNIFDEATLGRAMSVLKSELIMKTVPPDAPDKMRQIMALSLFYRGVLKTKPERIKEVYRSGGFKLQRPMSSGKQDLPTSGKDKPVHQPVIKVDGLHQTAGEAEYVNDIPKMCGQLYGAVVLAKQGPARLTSIDTSKAMKLKGVVAFFSAKDIPGLNNNYTPNMFIYEPEEVFSSGKILYAGQPVGMVVAESRDKALQAASLVDLKYSDQKKPLLSIKDVINSSESSSRIKPAGNITATKKGDDIKFELKNEFEMGEQYHYTMELQSCLVVPTEGGQLDVYPSSQWMLSVHSGIAQVLNIPKNLINLKVRRVGGAYGSKVTRSNVVANMCALASYKLNRPVNMVLDMESNMSSIGKREAIFTDFTAQVNSEGKIQTLNANLYLNTGITKNDDVVMFIKGALEQTYDSSTWNVNIFNVRTDIPSSALTRAPGTLEGVSFMEIIMEKIADFLNLDASKVRQVNMKDETIKQLFAEWKSTTEFDKRMSLIEQYNKQNRWKKRGMSLSPMSYPIEFGGSDPCLVSIMSEDGTVEITCGGLEIGQGLTTKVSQVAAFKLGLDINMIKVKPSMSVVTPNSIGTGGSVASEHASLACQKACEILMERLDPVRQKMKPNYNWKDLIAQAAKDEVTLSAYYEWKSSDKTLRPYIVYGVCALEVEVDILTGEHLIRRVDILEDAGDSLSPLIDLGQIEGAFVMGLGYFTSEHIKYNPSNGQLLTNRTWNYKPPGAKDIPVDFRVTLRKNSGNPEGVLGSKSTSEPPLCLSVSVLFAIKNAVKAARKDAGLNIKKFTLDPPCTPARVLEATGTDEKLFKL